MKTPHNVLVRYTVSNGQPYSVVIPESGKMTDREILEWMRVNVPIALVASIKIER